MEQFEVSLYAVVFLMLIYKEAVYMKLVHLKLVNLVYPMFVRLKLVIVKSYEIGRNEGMSIKPTNKKP